MSQRSRYILIIVVLLVVIGAGGALVYYFTRSPQRAGTAAGTVRTESGQLAIDRLSAVEQFKTITGSDIPWLHGCTTAFDPSQASSYSGQAGQNFPIAYACENTDPSVAHSLEVWSWDAPAYVFEVTGEPCRDDSTKAAQAAGTAWPPAISFPDYTAMVTWMSKFWTQGSTAQRNKTCADLPPANTNIQQLDFSNPSHTQTLQIPVGAGSVTFTTAHEFPNCEWYQYDDIVYDPTSQNAEPVMGAARHVAGQIGAANCAPAQQLGNLEARMFEDVDNNKEYSTPTAGGTDAPFAGQTVTVKDAQGALVTGCGGPTGGAGRVSCSQIPVGRYTVETTNPNAVLYSGPIVDPHDNPSPNEKHNATGSSKLTLTVIPGPQPQGTGNDIITFFDFGFTKKIIQAQVGNLEMRVFNDKDKNNEYSTPAAGCTATVCDEPFAFFDDFTIKNAAGEDIVAKGLCDQTQGTKTGGAGRFDCWQIPIGKYTIVANNPDPTKYTGPVVDSTSNPTAGEKHNAGGTSTLTLTLVEAPVPDGIDYSKMVFFDYGFRAKLAGPIVAGQAEPCTVDKSVADASNANEESPNDPKKSVSSTGEQLDFTIAYNCKGTGTATTVPTGTTILLTDEYDDALTTPIDSSITGGGSHDTAQHTINWTLQAGDSLTGTVNFSSRIDTGLAAGTYSSPNEVSIARNNEVEDQDQTLTSITVGGVTNNVPPPSNPPTPTPPGGGTGTTGNGTTPQTGVAANLAILLISLLAAGAITTFAVARLKRT